MNENNVQEEEKKDIKEEFNLWIENLNRSMYLSKFRQVLSEIESNKHNFDSLSSEQWRYKAIELKAIFHIIKRKMKKYPLEISKENSRQNHSILFWFNQFFIILEQLVLLFRDDVNENIDLNSKEIIYPIQYIILGHIQLLYLLIEYSYLNNQITEICAYLSMVDRLTEYSGYIININTLPLLQKIYLFRVKICLANCDYENGLKFLNITIDLCTKQLNHIVEYDFNIQNLDKYSKNLKKDNLINKMNIKIIERIFINICLAFYLRGASFELLGNVAKAIDSYKQSKFFATKFLKNKYYNFTMFFIYLQNSGYIYLAVMDELKELKEKKELEIEIQNKYLRRKRYFERLRYQKNYNKYYSSIASKQNLYKGELKKFLDTAAEKLYKEEKNRHSVLKKFTKTSYITSTLKMINDLLSKDFKNVLKKMDKVEVTKPSYEINSLINRTLLTKSQILFNKKNKFNNIKSKSIKKENKFNKSNKNAQSTINLNTDLKIRGFTNATTNNANLVNSISPINSKKFIKLKERPKSGMHSYNKNKINYGLNQTNLKKAIKKRRNKSTSNINVDNNENDKSDQSSLDETVDNEYFKNYQYLYDNNNLSLAKNSNSYRIKNTSAFFLKGKNKINVSSYTSDNYTSLYNYYRKINYSKNLPKSKSYLKIKIKPKKEFRIDVDNFGKTYLEKKIYLDKYCNDEIKFHRKLLESKTVELELTKEPQDFDAKKMKRDAERTFNKILELCKASVNKNINNYLRQRLRENSNLNLNGNMNGSMSNKNEKKNKDIIKSFQYIFNDKNKRDKILDAKEKKYILLNNEEKMKILNMECEQMNQKENEIKNKKKQLFKGIKKK